MKKRLWKCQQVVASSTGSPSTPSYFSTLLVRRKRGGRAQQPLSGANWQQMRSCNLCLCLMFMVSVTCTEFRPIKQRFVSWAVMLTQVKGSVCLNDLRSPEKLCGAASAFVTLSTQGCAHLNIQKDSLPFWPCLSYVTGSQTFSIHRKQVNDAEKEKRCMLLYTM